MGVAPDVPIALRLRSHLESRIAVVHFGFHGRPTRVLIANDQEWSARSLESVLVPLGCDVTRAFTGEHALSAATILRPHLVLLDTQLPDLTGFEVCRRLRADVAVGPSTPIVMTTSGPSGRLQRLEALQAGAWEFLAEPVDLELLLPRLLTYVGARRAAVSDRAPDGVLR